MARSELFAQLGRALAEVRGEIAPRALSRRGFLVMGAALAACTPPGREGPQGAPPVTVTERGIAVIGGGVAGLTAAFRLMQANRQVTLYEASTRLGGRMFTRRQFNSDGQFCELGGELVDTNHRALRELARELDVGIDRLAPPNDAGEDIFHHEGRLFASRDMIDRRGDGAFRRMAQRIAEDQAALLDANEEWTPRARELDGVSLKAYLDTMRDLAPDWAVDMIDLAYLGEFGLPTERQSALNLIDMIGTDVQNGFKLFGDSDELFRIRGGSSSLPEALVLRLGSRVNQRQRHELTAMAPAEGGIALTFSAPEGAVTQVHDAVVLALPLTKLRSVRGLDRLGLSETKLRAIREMSYGDNAKIMVATNGRPWRSPERRFPAPSNGTFYSDRGFQAVWETSRGQEGENGILTNFLSGVQDESAFARLASGLQLISPAIAESLDIERRVAMFWRNQSFALGSYPSASLGQYTTLLENAGAPELEGRLQFAGDYASVDFLGYMNGAVESAERAARSILGR